MCDALSLYPIPNTTTSNINLSIVLLHPCEGYFPCRGVTTNLFLVEAILVTCARGRSGKMDAPASQFSLEFSLLTRNKTAQKAHAWWRDTAAIVYKKVNKLGTSLHLLDLYTMVAKLLPYPCDIRCCCIVGYRESAWHTYSQWLDAAS